MVNERALFVIQRCYEFSYLRARQQAGAQLTPKERRRLNRLFQVFSEPDVMAARRHRRIPMMIVAEIKDARGHVLCGTVLNLSAGGMFLACKTQLPLGATVQVRVGSPGQTRYAFSAEVIRDEGAGMAALRFVGVPLELRYGSYTRSKAVRPAA